MVRPRKCRMIWKMPDITYFKPRGIPMRSLEEVNLNCEEMEAIRLKDTEGLSQEEAAEKMNISQPTFHRILVSGRKKVADALFNGKAIEIKGGNFVVMPHRHRGGRSI